MRVSAGWVVLLLGCEAASAPTPDDGRADAEAADAAAPGCSATLCGPYACHEIFETCRVSCERPEHCVGGFSCVSGFCVGHECSEPDPDARCVPYVCVRGVCATSCEASGCAAGFYCRGDVPRCVPRCVTRADPVCGGFVCDVEVGECEPYCFDGELECAPGFACGASGACEPRR